MQAHPFAMLIANEAGKAYATQVPVMVRQEKEKILVTGHLMRRQDHQLALEKNPEVLLVFTGPHSYVSAGWYENPAQASTWNYVSVHARGALQFGSEQELRDILQELSLHFEQGNAGSPTVMNNLPEQYTQSLMKAIVGFRIELQSIEHVWKLSQNRDEKSYGNIMDQLTQQGSQGEELAAMMQAQSSSLFKKPGSAD